MGRCWWDFFIGPIIIVYNYSKKTGNFSAFCIPIVARWFCRRIASMVRVPSRCTSRPGRGASFLLSLVSRGQLWSPYWHLCNVCRHLINCFTYLWVAVTSPSSTFAGCHWPWAPAKSCNLQSGCCCWEQPDGCRCLAWRGLWVACRILIGSSPISNHWMSSITIFAIYKLVFEVMNISEEPWTKIWCHYPQVPATCSWSDGCFPGILCSVNYFSSPRHFANSRVKTDCHCQAHAPPSGPCCDFLSLVTPLECSDWGDDWCRCYCF